jgi:hypothetical protein
MAAHPLFIPHILLVEKHESPELRGKTLPACSPQQNPIRQNPESEEGHPGTYPVQHPVVLHAQGELTAEKIANRGKFLFQSIFV